MDQSTEIDEKLRTLLIEGKEDEYFRLVVATFTPPLLQYVLNLIGKEDKDNADDIVQEGFTKFFYKTREWQTKGEIPTSINHYGYLRGVVRNVYLDTLKTKKHLLHTASLNALQERGSSQEADQITIDIADDIDVEQWVELKLLLNETNSKIELLKGDYRTVMRLIRDEDLSVNEIAEQMNRNPNVVKSLIRRARQQMKEMPSLPSAKEGFIRTQDTQLKLFAIARAQLESDDRAFIGKTYFVEAGISQNTPEGFTGGRFNVTVQDSNAPIPFDIVVHAEKNIELLEGWHQRLRYIPTNAEPQLVHFPFKVTAEGKVALTINFYREQQWLHTVQLEFEGIDQSQLAKTIYGR